MPTEDEIVAMCRQRIELGSRSFAGAARLFDRRTRESAYMLYAWCRHCDDAIDGQQLGFPRSSPATPAAGSSAALAVLADLERRTRAALAGRPEGGVYDALHTVVERHGIPAVHPLELIEGFRLDATGFRPQTIGDTLTYCYHVAGVVGVMMAIVMGARGADALNRAADLGIAFQLTNIVRDIVADAEAGRVYLPADWLRKSGLDGADLASPARREVVFGVARRMLAEADRYYASASGGLRYLPFRSAWAVASARNIYRRIGAIVLDEGSAAWAGRASVGGGAKLAGVASALAPALLATLPAAPPPPREGLWTRPGLGSREGMGFHVSGRA